jgi:DNA-binding transcriptional regulator PaaX
MSIVQELLYIVSNYPGGYRLLYDLLYDSQPPGADPKKLYNTARATLTRLRKQGLVIKGKDKWQITPEGKELLKSKGNQIKRFFPTKGKLKGEKKLIVIFDIPEKKRKYRDWLRSELIGFGFELVQKSAWFGPALPKEFIEYLEEVHILQYIRFFKVSPKDIG